MCLHDRPLATKPVFASVVRNHCHLIGCGIVHRVHDRGVVVEDNISQVTFAYIFHFNRLVELPGKKSPKNLRYGGTTIVNHVSYF
jgi:hypothetical protein